jgi:t-SNARE complex subunit (syntaxin)
MLGKVEDLMAELCDLTKDIVDAVETNNKILKQIRKEIKV